MGSLSSPGGDVLSIPYSNHRPISNRFRRAPTSHGLTHGRTGAAILSAAKQ